MQNKTRYLDTMDGYEFEQLCKAIYENSGYNHVELTSKSGDKGRDIIIYTNEGKIVVECKHRPNSSIGRPVIQKLHSAAVSGNATKGVIITTGNFSKAATEHAKTLYPSIELIDLPILRDMARRAGINIVTTESNKTINVIKILNDDEFQNNYISYIENKLTSKPNKIEDSIKFNTRKISLLPVYRIDYSINASFSTSVGIIHNENGSGLLFIGGNDGASINSTISNHFDSAPIEELSDDLISRIENSNLPTYKKLVSTVKTSAIKSIITNHTKNISYYGRNNHHYTKSCVPKQSDVSIGNISQVYIPFTEIEIILLGKKRNLEILDNTSTNFYPWQGNINTCDICHMSINEKGYLCNGCGKITHPQTTFSSHGYNCKHCGKIICSICAKYYRKYLFFKQVICNECASKEEAQGTKIDFVMKRVKRVE